MRIDRIILECAKKNMSKKSTAEHIGYSTRQLSRICKKKFNRSYKKLQYLMLLAGIYKMRMNNSKTQEIADQFFKGNTPQLCKYVADLTNLPLSKIKIKGDGRSMTKAQIQIWEAQVITALVNSSGNITLKQMGVPRFVIAGLRKKGYNIISVPGPRGGYNLGRTSKSACLDWINKIRTNRYNKPGNFTF